MYMVTAISQVWNQFIPLYSDECNTSTGFIEGGEFHSVVSIKVFETAQKEEIISR